LTAQLSIQLLVFEGCPLANAAREALRQALAELGISAFEEIDLLDPSTPEDLRGWGSPTILVNGRDVAGLTRGDNLGCRVYPGPDRVPSAATLVRSIRKARRREAAGEPPQEDSPAFDRTEATQMER
jgi:hypothetical protein